MQHPYVPNGQPIPNVTSVTNEGMAVGYNDQNQPFFLWDAINDTQKRIGGISAGAGVGGVPRFDASGKFIAAPMESDRINVFTAWTSLTNPEMAPYLFCQTCYNGDFSLFAVGYSPDGNDGVIVKSSNCGQKWKRADMLSRQNADGKWIGGRGIPGLPVSGPWIWSEKEGFSYLQDYVEKKLGHELEDFGIVSVYDMSPNGRYICGYGMWEGDPAAYVFDLFAKVEGVEEMEAAQVKAAVYPNPVVSELHVDLPYDSDTVNTTITLYDMQGGVVRRMNGCRQSNVMNVDGLSSGLYVLDVCAGNTRKAYKVVVK